MNKISELALFGGTKAVLSDTGNIFKWPIITKDDEDSVLDVLRNGSMSGTNVTMRFEKEFAEWQGVKYALGCNNGTAALHSAMFGCRVGVGDEVICPSITYWASAAPTLSLGATPVFCDIKPDTLCIDSKDIEHRITEKTKAILVVHYLGHPADMDPIMEIAERHGLKVIEDVSHAQGGLYKGRKLGSIGHVAGISLMSGKSFAVGEGGILCTDDVEIYERAIAFGHYERFNGNLATRELMPFAGMPMGGYKYRMHQMSSAVGCAQLKHYDSRSEEIRKSMNYFWDLLEGVPGLRAHRTPSGSNSNMGGWYAPHGFYAADELEGLSITRFTEAVRAEGVAECIPGCNIPLHLHPLFKTCDVYGDGKPTRIAHSKSDVREGDMTLPVSERIGASVYSIPWFKHYRPEIIKEFALAFRKVSYNFRELMKDDSGNPEHIGGWSFYKHG